MADELCRMSQIVEEMVKKPKVSPTNYSEDPTLRLPDPLLRSIFSYLRCRDLVNVSLVSKNWHSNTPSYFAFDFEESLFFEKTRTALSLAELHNKFMDWIRSSLETCKSKLIKAEKRVLRVHFSYHENIYDLMTLMDENNFHEVYLRFGSLYDSLPYIFHSTHLTVLHLTHCTINENIFRGEEKFDSWQELKLVGVTLSRETLVAKAKCI